MLPLPPAHIQTTKEADFPCGLDAPHSSCLSPARHIILCYFSYALDLMDILSLAMSGVLQVSMDSSSWDRVGAA